MAHWGLSRQKQTNKQKGPYHSSGHLVSSLPPRRRGFSSTSVHLRFVLDRVALRHAFPLVFPPSVSFLQCCIFMFIYMLLLPKEQTNEAWESPNNWRALDAKMLTLLFSLLKVKNFACFSISVLVGCHRVSGFRLFNPLTFVSSAHVDSSLSIPSYILR